MNSYISTQIILLTFLTTATQKSTIIWRKEYGLFETTVTDERFTLKVDEKKQMVGLYDKNVTIIEFYCRDNELSKYLEILIPNIKLQLKNPYSILQYVIKSINT